MSKDDKYCHVAEPKIVAGNKTKRKGSRGEEIKKEKRARERKESEGRARGVP
jgi:hypothetical protein